MKCGRLALLCACAFAGTLAQAMPIGLRTAMMGRAATRYPSEQELKPKLVGAGKVTTPKTWKVGQKVTWKAVADKGSVFARWEGPLVDSLDLAKNERRNPSLAFAVPEGFETNQIKAVFIPLEDDGLYALGITQTEFDLKETVSDVWVTDDSQSYVTATASGLPTGLKFNAKTLQITGTPTKGGVYWVQVKAKNASGYQWAENVMVTVSGDGKEAKEPKLTRTAYYPLTVICATEGGTASGTGVYAEGKKVTIKATPAKGYVFAGWYETAAEANGGGHAGRVTRPASMSVTLPGADCRSPSMSVVVPEMRYVFARFATKEEDAASLALAVEDAATEKDGTLELDLGACVEALSLPKLSVTGLPSGVKYDAKTMMLTGKAKKPGVYTVTVKATSASVTRTTDVTTATFKITVPNFECAAWQNLWNTEPWKSEAKTFAKAKALAIDAGTWDACPYEGTVTLKFAASGAVTASGKFVTGQDARGKDIVYSANCSSVLVPEGDDGFVEEALPDSNARLYRIFLYFPPKAGKFGGYAAEVPLAWDGSSFKTGE